MEVWNRDWDDFRNILAFRASAAIALVARADYGIQGTLPVLRLHALRDRKPFHVSLAYPLLPGGIAAFAAFVPISLYNGQRGFIRRKWLQYAFYLFRPVHILLLCLVKNSLYLDRK